MKTFVEAVDRLPEAHARQIRADTPPEMLAEIDKRGALAWLPVEINIEMTRAVSKTLGDEGAHEFYKSFLLGVFDTSMFRTFVESGLRLLLSDLVAALRYVPLAYPMMFKNCGQWKTVSADEHSAVLELGNLASVCAHEPLWLASATGSLSSLLVLSRREGDCELVDFDADAGWARYRLHWKEPSSPQS